MQFGREVKNVTVTFFGHKEIFDEIDGVLEDILIMLVEKLIQKANDEIKNACFSIEPKLINGKNESCTFCPYKDICYMKFEDIKELEYKPFKNNL